MEFKLDILASLARQMKYAPPEKRLAQLAAAETLLLRIDPEKGYPAGYVVHAVTGYRAKALDLAAAESAELLTGVALQNDLGLLIESVSGDMELSALDERLGGEPILGIDDVCRRFSVTSKTIQRWRRKGLPARRFIFPDENGDVDNGKKRVGFRLSCVEGFIANQEGSAQRPAGVDPLSPDEQAQVIRHARRLVEGGHDRREVVRRVARSAGRSSLAVLHTLEQHDRINGDDSILTRAPEPLDQADAAAALERCDNGESLTDVAAEVGRPRAAIYRLLVEQQAERLAAAAVKFHDDPLYHGDAAEAERQVNEIVRNAEQTLAAGGEDAGERRQMIKPPRDLPPYLAELYRTPLLTPALERALFLKFNFHKYRFAELRSRLDPHLCRRRDLARLERHLELARQTKNRITTANLRLVVSVARKHQRPGLDLMELVSDGNVVLMRAVEGFDIHRGFKFSTYATLALMKGYARSVPAMQAQQTAAVGLSMEPATHDAGPSHLAAREEVGRLLDQLTDRERAVLARRWELAGDEEITGLDEIENLSATRLRRIEQSALDKLRGLVEVA